MTERMITDEQVETALRKRFKDEVTWDKGVAPWTADQFRVEMRATLEAALTLHPSPSASEAQVKPLEWGEPVHGTWHAVAVVGYSAFQDMGNGKYFVRVGFPAEDFLGPFDSLEAAKAAAQADYERRILSALTPEQGETAPSPETHLRVSQAADAYVAKQGIEHSGGIIERAFEDGATWASAQISDEAIGIIWTAAMTAAVNIIVKRQNDLNDDDGPLPVLNEQGDCINALKKWMHVDDVFLEELRHMLGDTSSPCDCCEDIRRAESDLAGLDDEHQERVDQFSVMGADWAEPNYGSTKPPPPAENVTVSDLTKRLRSMRSCTVCEGDGIKSNGKQCGGCGGVGDVHRYDRTGVEAANEIDRAHAALRALMAKLADLLDEDHFADCEEIVRKVGIAPAPQPRATPPSPSPSTPSLRKDEI